MSVRLVCRQLGPFVSLLIPKHPFVAEALPEFSHHCLGVRAGRLPQDVAHSNLQWVALKPRRPSG